MIILLQYRVAISFGQWPCIVFYPPIFGGPIRPVGIVHELSQLKHFALVRTKFVYQIPFSLQFLEDMAPYRPGKLDAIDKM